MGCDAQLAAQLYKHFLLMTCDRSKGQTDLVYGLRSEFISRSVHAGLQVSTCIAVMTSATLVITQTHRLTAFDWLYY